jgi:hypothetical protein
MLRSFRLVDLQDSDMTNHRNLRFAACGRWAILSAVLSGAQLLNGQNPKVTTQHNDN